MSAPPVSGPHRVVITGPDSYSPTGLGAQPGGAVAAYDPADDFDRISEDVTEEITDDDREDAAIDDALTRSRLSDRGLRATIQADPTWRRLDELVKRAQRVVRRTGGPALA